jgi:hypothetical protein
MKKTLVVLVMLCTTAIVSHAHTLAMIIARTASYKWVTDTVVNLEDRMSKPQTVTYEFINTARLRL